MTAQVWVSDSLIELRLRNGAGETEELVGVIDTGASVIRADRRVALRLGLIASNRKPIEVADGSMVQSVAYPARMEIEGLGFGQIVEVFTVEMAVPSRRVLLGRSFLRNYNITYMGLEDRFHYYNHNPYYNAEDDFAG